MKSIISFAIAVIIGVNSIGAQNNAQIGSVAGLAVLGGVFLAKASKEELKKRHRENCLKYLLANEKITFPQKLNIEPLSWEHETTESYSRASVHGIKVEAPEFGNYLYLFLRRNVQTVNKYGVGYNEYAVLKYDRKSLQDFYLDLIVAITDGKRIGDSVRIIVDKGKRAESLGIIKFENFKGVNSFKNIITEYRSPKESKYKTSYISLEKLERPTNKLSKINPGLNHNKLILDLTRDCILLYLPALDDIFSLSFDDLNWMFNSLK